MAVRKPERVDSISMLISAVFCFTAAEARCIAFRRAMTTTSISGTITSTTSASRHWMRNITISAPTIVATEIRISSGP